MGKIQLSHNYKDIISTENLLIAWREFARGKKDKADVQEFSAQLFDNIISLHNDLAQFAYQHGDYQSFNISDPKPRIIHKARVRDRVLHHAIYRKLYPFFDRTFTADSFSCRLGKGTHKALNRFRAMAYKISQNNTRTCWVLKCDIRKFFASIDQVILQRILAAYIPNQDILWLLEQVIASFNSGTLNKGLPLGNLTSQLFCNVYMNEFDKFMKHKLKAEHYIRYADDFVILSEDKIWLTGLVPQVSKFLQNQLKLNLHQDKVFIKTLASGIDFLGWVHFPNHRVLRTATKRRMFRRWHEHAIEQTRQSYLGLLRHGDTYELRELIRATLAKF
jgi:retron-type reverse transcriptase